MNATLSNYARALEVLCESYHSTVAEFGYKTAQVFFERNSFSIRAVAITYDTTPTRVISDLKQALTTHEPLIPTLN